MTYTVRSYPDGVCKDKETEKLMLRFGEVCAGISATSVAMKGIAEPVWFAENDKFASAMLAHHHPNTPNLGDMTKLTGETLNGKYGQIDMLVGGTPCQGFSVAGSRDGLRDERSGLAIEFVRLAGELRSRWLLWENVPGVLSQKDENGVKGGDVRAFCAALRSAGYGLCWRVLDAEYVRVDGFPRAVPQRRRRVFLVGYFGDWRRAAAVLLEPESVRGNHPPRREAWKDVAPSLSARTKGGGGLGTDFDLDGGLVAHALTTKAYRLDPSLETFVVAFDARQSDTLIYGDVTGPLDTDGHTIGIVQNRSARRLMPLECERLMGMPDNFTNIPYRKKPSSDNVRYKALGNSIAVNCLSYIGQRMQLVDNLQCQ